MTKVNCTNIYVQLTCHVAKLNNNIYSVDMLREKGKPKYIQVTNYGQR